MSDVSALLRDEVILRAANRCEYCGLSQAGQVATFHIDHVVPRAAGGSTESSNLALACVSCSLRKLAKQSATDPETGLDVALFNPREQTWIEHFRWDGAVIVPISPI
jgi:5-methylcytosine-specific restriction endonuclease McrA